MAFPDTAPRKGDSDNNLLFKIAQELSEQNGGAFAPFLGDSDNVLLQKILQGIILGGGGGGNCGTCPADLAACNTALSTCSAALVACNASLASQQDMQWNWTPVGSNLGEMFGYGIGGTASFPGITSMTFRGVTSQGGFTISSKADLLTLAFPNVTSMTAAFASSTNPKLTSISFPAWTTGTGQFTASTNTLLTSISVPVLTTFGNTLGWTTSSNPVLTSLSFPSLTTNPSGSWVISSNTTLSSISFPVLTSFAAAFTANSNPALVSLNLPLVSVVTGFSAASNTSLPSISLPSVTSIGGIFSAPGNTVLTTVSLPLMVTLSGTMTLTTCPALANLVLTNYVPANGRVHSIAGAALTQVSVDLILARGVANAAYVTGTIDVSGGTSSTPSAAGLVNKSTLITRGVTVLTN